METHGAGRRRVLVIEVRPGRRRTLRVRVHLGDLRATVRRELGLGRTAVVEPMCARVRPRSGWESLSERERTIADLIGQAMTNRQIASRVYLSPHTVNYHLRQIFRKLDINSRVHLARLVQTHQ